jgi:hypothetical protein
LLRAASRRGAVRLFWCVVAFCLVGGLGGGSFWRDAAGIGTLAKSA